MGEPTNDDGTDVGNTARVRRHPWTVKAAAGLIAAAALVGFVSYHELDHLDTAGGWTASGSNGWN